ncbi:hypothetical protein D3C73_457000 [compost metagenome]
MAADTFQLKRGTTAAVNAYLPAVGEPVYDITLKQLRVGDGVTMGGTDASLSNANLNALAGLTGAADKLAYFTGVGSMSTTDLTPIARTLLDDTTQAAMQTTLGLVPQSSQGDATLNRVLRNGAHGLGADGTNTTPTLVATFSSNLPTGLYRCTGGTTVGNPFVTATTGVVLAITTAATLTVYYVIRNDTGEAWTTRYSSGVLDAWKPLALGGANSNITSLSGLTTPLSIAQGGTGNGTGLAATATALATSRSISATGDATWTVNFNGTANVTAALTLAAFGVGAGTYGSVTVNTKGLVTAASVATPVANGGTGQTTIAAAASALAVPKFAWTSYTPTVTANTGTYTTASATGSHMVANGICHLRIAITITTKGTGVLPIVTLPFPALAGSASLPIPARENAVNGKMGAGFITPGLLTLLVVDYINADLITTDGAVVYINGSYPIA